ncbi:MAG: hypothetical protein WAO68_09915, partial [Clostridium sp.]
MRIDDIIENLRLFNMGKVIRIINQNNFNNIVRKALISDEKDMNLKIDSWIKYMVYFILNLCAKFSLKSQPSIYGKYGKRIL